MNDGTDRAFERVHRKILARESRIAVLEVLVENWREEVVPEGQGVSGAVPGVVGHCRLTPYHDPGLTAPGVSV